MTKNSLNGRLDRLEFLYEAQESRVCEIEKSIVNLGKEVGSALRAHEVLIGQVQNDNNNIKYHSGEIVKMIDKLEASYADILKLTEHIGECVSRVQKKATG